MSLLSVGDLEGFTPIFRGKVGNALAKGLIRLLSLDKANDLYDRFRDLEGPGFTRAAFEDIGYSYKISFVGGSETGDDNGEIFDMSDELIEKVRSFIPEGPFITVSNHPCGHVDGMILVDIFSRARQNYKVVVNQVLARIKTLEPSFISVTPTGKEKTSPTVASVRGVKYSLKHLSEGGSLGLFPAGAVSNLNLKDGYVRDRVWQEPVIRMIQKAGVPVVPVRFFDGNSRFFYSLGLIDWRVRLLRLVSEVFNKNGKVMRVGIGPVITVEQQKRASSEGVGALSDLLRNAVYDMKWQ